MKTEGHWASVMVVSWNLDKSKILLRHEDGKEEWVEIERIKNAFHLPQKAMAYITLPTMSSRHFGMEYDGFCLER